MNQIEQAIQKAAQHWANQTDEFTDGNAIVTWLESRKGPIAFTPKRGWGKAKFSDWGNVQKIERGLIALRKAINGNPSRQWLTAWAN